MWDYMGACTLFLPLQTLYTHAQGEDVCLTHRKKDHEKSSPGDATGKQLL